MKVDIEEVVLWFCEYLHCEPFSQRGKEVRRFIEKKLKENDKMEKLKAPWFIEQHILKPD